MSARDLGARELVELTASVLAGETSAAELAADFDVSTRYIQRLRARLRKDGLRVPVPESTGNRNAFAECNALRARRSGGPWSWR